jgi:hypothetical protein
MNILLDISKAFDSVPHRKLYECLKKRGTPTRYLNLFSSLYFRKMKTRIIINGVPSEEVKITRGIFQGSVFSPFLFEVYIDELACTLSELFGSTIPRSLFFVDDILLQPPDFQTAQTMLDVCQLWSTDSECDFNPKKNYLLTDGETETDVLLIAGKPLLEVKSQSYLGLPFTKKGISWKEHVTMRLKKFTDLIGLFKVKGTAWPPWLRLILFKTFARPQLEYAAPLLYAWSLHPYNTTLWTQLQDSVTKKEEDAIRWILDTTLSRPSMDVLYYIVNVEPYALRLRYLAGNSYPHFSNLHEQNPWHTVRDLLSRQPLQDNCCVIPTLSRMLPDYSEYFIINEALPNRRKMGFKAWFQKKHRGRKTLKHRLNYYVFKDCRSSKYGPDACLHIKDISTRKKALDWRRNLLFHGKKKKCFVCGEQFNRSHLNSCATLDNLPAHARPPELSRLLTDHRRFLEVESADALVPYDGNYTVLDLLLNEKNYEYFACVTEWIETTLLSDLDAATGILAVN